MCSDFFNAITSIQTPFNMVVLIVLIGTVGAVISALIQQIGRYASHREEVGLKQDMLDRGMSAEEIAEVMRATALRKGEDN